MEPHEVKRLDARSLKALAHPLRLRLLGALRLHGPATATMLAERFGESSGATSYHLRQLAVHGFVQDEKGRGSGRERWWRASHRSTQWSTADFLDEPGSLEAASFLEREALGIQVRRTQNWLLEQRTWDREWVDAAFWGDWNLRLRADQLRALTTELTTVIQRYWDADPAPDAEQVALYLNAFPHRGEPL